MLVVRDRAVLLLIVTLVADAVAFGAKLQGMRLVAVGTGHALGEHLALAKRGVVVDLVHHLAIGLEQTGLQQRRHMRLEELLPRAPAFGDPGAAGMAHAAGLEFRGTGPRRAARGVAGGRVDRPVNAGALVEVDGEPVVAALAPGQPTLLALGPGDVGRAGTVAGLAADIDLGPGRRVSVRGRVVVLAQLGRVALGAHEVPGLVDPGPMQRIAGFELLVGVEMEPALPALILGPRVPGDAERLHPAVGKGDQVLLQRVDAEGVADLEVVELAVRPVGGDEEPAVASEETRGHLAMGDAGVIKVAEDGLGGRLLHRQVMVRAAPRRHLALVAATAGGAAGKGPGVDRLRGGSGTARRRGRHHHHGRGCQNPSDGGSDPHYCAAGCRSLAQT
jgi:hypothetical protein